MQVKRIIVIILTTILLSPLLFANDYRSYIDVGVDGRVSGNLTLEIFFNKKKSASTNPELERLQTELAYKNEQMRLAQNITISDIISENFLNDIPLNSNANIEQIISLREELLELYQTPDFKNSIIQLEKEIESLQDELAKSLEEIDSNFITKTRYGTYVDINNNIVEDP